MHVEGLARKPEGENLMLGILVYLSSDVTAKKNIDRYGKKKLYLRKEEIPNVNYSSSF